MEAERELNAGERLVCRALMRCLGMPRGEREQLARELSPRECQQIVLAAQSPEGGPQLIRELLAAREPAAEPEAANRDHDWRLCDCDLCKDDRERRQAEEGGEWVTAAEAALEVTFEEAAAVPAEAVALDPAPDPAAGSAAEASVAESGAPDAGPETLDPPAETSDENGPQPAGAAAESGAARAPDDVTPGQAAPDPPAETSDKRAVAESGGEDPAAG